MYQIDDIKNTILCGDVLLELQKIPTESIDAIITSPPYWSLRAYGTEPQIWDAKPDCSHVWGSQQLSSNLRFRPGKNTTVGNHLNPEIYPRTLKHKSSETNHGKETWYKENGAVDEIQSMFCMICNAWKGELGLEPDPLMYIEHLLSIFDEVKRVLKKDGTCWVNLGDTYSESGNGTNDYRTEKSLSINGRGKLALKGFQGSGSAKLSSKA